jgi:hypothetical protein
MASTHRSKEDVWLQRLCLGIGFVHKAMRIGCDNSSTMFHAKDLVYHPKTKNIYL